MSEKIIYLNGAFMPESEAKSRYSTPASMPGTVCTMSPELLPVDCIACAIIRHGCSARCVARRRDGAGNPRSSRTQQGDPGQSVIV